MTTFKLFSRTITVSAPASWTDAVAYAALPVIEEVIAEATTNLSDAIRDLGLDLTVEVTD